MRFSEPALAVAVSFAPGKITLTAVEAGERSPGGGLMSAVRPESEVGRGIAPESRRLAGILLILVPAVAFGGASLLSMIVGETPGYLDNAVRQDLLRAGHAHGGVLLVLALVMLRYVDEARLSGPWLWLARLGVPIAAILMPAGFFLSVVRPEDTEPSALIVLVPVGGLFLVGGVLSLGIGLLRGGRPVTSVDPAAR